MDLGLSGRVAMVAAASKGIGRAIARSLLAEGCRVSICSRDPGALEKARADLLAAVPGGRVLAWPCDVTRESDLAQWHAQTVEKLGDPDILVTNTGGPPAARFLALTEAHWREGIEGTLLNVVRLCRLVIPKMKERRWGRILHVTSFVAKQPVPLLTISSTLRAGLSALTKTLAAELAGDGVLVNAVLPGHVMTDRQTHLNQIRSREEGVSIEEYAARVERTIPIRRYAEPREIGDVIAFLASERASYVTGTTVQVDGGMIQSTF